LLFFYGSEEWQFASNKDGGMMKCFHCKEEINESKGYEITAPDGDVFHKECLPKYEKERDSFFDNIIHRDILFANWMGVPIGLIKQEG